MLSKACLTKSEALVAQKRACNEVNVSLMLETKLCRYQTIPLNWYHFRSFVLSCTFTVTGCTHRYFLILNTWYGRYMVGCRIRRSIAGIDILRSMINLIWEYRYNLRQTLV